MLMLQLLNILIVDLIWKFPVTDVSLVYIDSRIYLFGTEIHFQKKLKTG